MRRLAVSTLSAVLALALAVASVAADWPITCVAANDAFERDAGRLENVGIYQRVFGDQAEAACQRDHLQDIRRSFAWAINPDQSVHVPPPPTTPAPTPTPEPQPTGPIVDASLHHVWHLLSTTTAGATVLAEPAIQTVRVAWGATSGTTAAYYVPATHTIVMGTNYQHERPEALAAILAHELAHAASGIPTGFTYNDCLRFELWAFLVQGLVWYEFGLSPTTDLEWTHENIVVVVVSAPLGDLDEDLSDWPYLLDYIGVDLGYFQRCAA